MPSGPADPTRTGAALRVVDLGVGEASVIDLPAQHWRMRRLSPTGSARYEYDDPAGPCQRVVLQTAKLLRARCSGPGVTLGAPGTRRLSVQLTLGTASRYCLIFGGTVRKDTATAYRAVHSAAPLACP